MEVRLTSASTLPELGLESLARIVCFGREVRVKACWLGRDRRIGDGLRLAERTLSRFQHCELAKEAGALPSLKLEIDQLWYQLAHEESQSFLLDRWERAERKLRRANGAVDVHLDDSIRDDLRNRC